MRSHFKVILTSLKLSQSNRKVQEDMKQLTQKLNGLRLPPSEIAKAHKKMPLANIGVEMSKLDPHYIPSPAQGVNPFLPLFGNGRFMGNFFYSCIEFNHINNGNEENGTKSTTTRPIYRKTVSMIGQEAPSLETLTEHR